MSAAKYRVETFIIPLCNSFPNNNFGTKTDDAKITDKLRSKDDCEKDLESICTPNKADDHDPDSVIKKADNLLSVLEESLHDLQNSSIIEDTGDEEKGNDKEETVDFHFMKANYPSTYSIHTLGPIDEADEKDCDFCYHGCKNGCSATVQTPQEVSQEIFKGHWLQKLEMIKKKETALRNRECILQSRERALFMREREVRVLERNLRDRLKQVETYFNQMKQREMKDQQEDTSDLCAHLDSASPSIKSEAVSSEKISTINHADTNRVLQDPTSLDNMINKEIEQKKISSCSSSSSSDNIGSEEMKMSRSSLRSKGFHSSSSRFTTHTERRGKKPYRPSYDDLDSTLSADIGDTSFIQTSQKFNPEVYKRPYAFRRSVSERRAKHSDIGGKTHKQEVWYPTEVEQGKILQRVTKNISASKDKSTKFQHYGLIDQNVDVPLAKVKEELKDEKKYSYLNLEVGSKSNLQRIVQGSKERPMSWNEGTDEWLQKKRQAYNMATRRTQMDDWENKENLKCNTKKEKQNVLSKKRELTNRIFTIFR